MPLLELAVWENARRHYHSAVDAAIVNDARRRRKPATSPSRKVTVAPLR